jgi:hypothetical protein
MWLFAVAARGNKSNRTIEHGNNENAINQRTETKILDCRKSKTDSDSDSD